MKEESYEFYGLDAKTELLITIALIIPAVAVALLLVFAYIAANDGHAVVRRTLYSLPFLVIVVYPFLLGGFLWKYMVKKTRKLWRVTTLKNGLLIWYGAKKQAYVWKDIEKVKNYGNALFRYYQSHKAVKTKTSFT